MDPSLFTDNFGKRVERLKPKPLKIKGASHRWRVNLFDSDRSLETVTQFMQVYAGYTQTSGKR